MTDTSRIVQDLTDKIAELDKLVTTASVGAATAQAQADTCSANAADATSLRDQYQAVLNQILGS